MSIFLKNTKKIVLRIDEFLDNIEVGLLVFKDGVNSYLFSKSKDFKAKLQELEMLEAKADKLQRQIENDLFIHSIIPQHSSDVVQLLDILDDLLDTAKETLNQFVVEIPNIPEELNDSFMRLTEISVQAAEEVMPAARAYFKEPHTIRDKIHRVYHFERETDILANKIKKQVFHKMDNLNLAEKFHLRYMTLHIETISDKSKIAADMLSRMAIRNIT